MITGFCFGASSTADQPLAETFFNLGANPNPRLISVGLYFSGAYVADKSFEGAEFHPRWLDHYGTEVIRPPKRNSKRGGRWRTMLEGPPDAGIFPSLLALQERGLRNNGRRRGGSLDGEITKRELDVLGLLVGELSARKMAQSLFVAPSTVRTQLKSVYRKLGVSSREEAVEEARARGLLSLL